MWPKLCFLVFATLAFADHNPGWRQSHEYIYQVNGFLLTGLNQVDQRAAGIYIKAQLTVRPRPDGHLAARLTHTRYADVHTRFDTSRPSDEGLSFQPLPLTEAVFQMRMDNGVIRDLVLPAEVPNWQANVIKGIASQLQLDTDAENQIRSYINLFTQEGSNNAVFKTMEETVTGESETLYEIHPLNEYVLQSEPWLAPLEQHRKSGEMIEIVKHKNFTHSRESPSYHYGFQGVKDFDVQNKIGNFFEKLSTSRAIISGTLRSFTIHSSLTVEEITIKPTLNEKERGITRTYLNLTLMSFEQKEEEFQDVSNPVNVGLVYSYNQPFGEAKVRQYLRESSESSESDEFLRKKKYRGVATSYLSSAESGSDVGEEQNTNVQEKPHIHEAPAAPLLPFTIGYDGQAISTKQNIKEKVRSLAKKIGQEMQKPEQIPEENTVGKFLVLSSLVRVMNYEEIKFVSAQIYSKEQHNDAAFAWFAFRDAVAAAGTGPALLTIEQWIREEKIQEREAAGIISTATSSAREPTEKYMHVLFKMISSEHIMHQKYLNESVLLGFTKLIHEVYVHDDVSHNKFPVHSFGSFNTVQGRQFVTKDVIPHLASQFQAAVKRGDTQQIHVYIRALGNVGHRQILGVFKPYFEGTQKMSQFQRVLMVVALDKLVHAEPRAARNVLYKIYQNNHDFPQVRVAAVYQLMKTRPTPAMLQRMATYTNIDTNVHVNSAVKSAIESLTQIQSPQYSDIRTAASSAKPLLTKKQFNVDDSQQFLQKYIIEHMEQMEVKQILESFGGEDAFVPKGINYFLSKRIGENKQNLFNVQSMVSSIEDLVNVAEEQTHSYQRLLKEKQAYESIKTEFSSEYTAKWLNLQNEQREQLEGFLMFDILSLQKVWSFDNRTIENLTQIVREIEETFQNKKHFHYNKMTVNNEMVLSFPTSWGLPFIYTYDSPILVNLESDLKMEAQPRIASNEGLKRPETISAEYAIRGFVSARTQGQFGIFTPFNNKRYSAGYDKNIQIVLPHFSGKLTFDVQNQQLTTEIRNVDQRPKVNLVHFSTWPYTVQYLIDDVKPNTEIVTQKSKRVINTVLGDKTFGMHFSLHVTGPRQLDYAYFYHRMQKQGFSAFLLGPWLDEKIQHFQFDLNIDTTQSTTKKVVFHLGRQLKNYQDKYLPSDEFKSEYPIARESWKRQKDALKNVTKDVKNVYGQAIDMNVVLNGNKDIKYSLTFAGAKTNIDPKFGVIVKAQKVDSHNKPVKFEVSVKGHLHNTPSLNLQNAIQFDPTTVLDIHGLYETQTQAPTRISAKVKLSKSENRKQYLEHHFLYQQCKNKEQKENNAQLPACAALTEQANILDKFEVKIDHQNVHSSFANCTYRLYSILRQHTYHRFFENVFYENKEYKPIFIEGQYSPALDKVNVSFHSETASPRADIFNFNVHPLFRNLFIRRFLNYGEEFQPTCVVDNSAINTWDNKTYPATLTSDWTVLMHYVPRRPYHQERPVTQQLNQMVEGYILYARASATNQKEIKIMIQSRNTLSKVIDLTLKPAESSDAYPRLFVQNERIIYDQQGSHIYDDYMQVFKLPNGELKVKIYDALDVIYDGQRAKVFATTSKFRDAARGLCGTFTGEQETDFTHPSNCVVHSADVFVATNTIAEKMRTKRMNDMLMIKSEEKNCYQKSVGYVPVVSASEAGIVASPATRAKAGKNMIFRTRYVERDGQVCFTTKRHHACIEGASEDLVRKEHVEVHCVKDGQIAALWKKQIDQGGNPDFSLKGASRKIDIVVPQNCEF